MKALPITPPLVYNESWKGVYGEFGSGAGLRAMYLLTSISPADLDKVSLLEEIPGSERWRVRDLFQREVDKERVTGPLMSYLKTEERVRFFNPLTLTVLPMDDHGGSVLERMPAVVESRIEDSGFQWRVFERPRYYRMRHIHDQPDYGQIDWNEKRSRIVAIDGQHRLSALKRLHDLPGDTASFRAWRIPLVIVSFRAGEGRAEPPGVLEVVRSIFVDINTEARQVNEARQILLNDKSVNCLATQELLEVAHGNDLKPLQMRRQESLPLLFFDWRGQERGGEVVPAPAAVKSIGELRSWFEYYILGNDLSAQQTDALGPDKSKKLAVALRRGQVQLGEGRKVREQVRKRVLPGLLHLFEGFDPYRAYVAGLRRLELQYYTGNDVQHHAFDCLRFGTSYATGPTERLVLQVVPHIEREVEALKQEHLHWPLDQDVGLRGIVCAFGWLCRELGYPDWMEFSEWFTKNVNCLHEDGWLGRDAGQKGTDFLRHVIFDHNDTTVNYRLQDARKALGAYVALLVGAYGPPPGQWPSIRVHLLEMMRGTLVRGYKKELRPAFKETYPDGGKLLNDAVKEAARKSAGRQLRRFERELEVLEEAVAISEEATVEPDGG